MPQTKEDLKKLVDLAFPPPPAEIFSLSGVVKTIVGATIAMEVDDPEDYLPHPDGSPRRKQTRFASLLAETKITLIDTTQLDREGNPKVTNDSAHQFFCDVRLRRTCFRGK
ncbi:MAG: hypothetical protein QME25_01685 [Bacteroidota bacterium]|nr:hypothetical protein [Bacteroidota bacterium]